MTSRQRPWCWPVRSRCRRRGTWPPGAGRGWRAPGREGGGEKGEEGERGRGGGRGGEEEGGGGEGGGGGGRGEEGGGEGRGGGGRGRREREGERGGEGGGGRGAGGRGGGEGGEAPGPEGKGGYAADQGAQAGQRLGTDPVVHPYPALVPVDQARLVQHLHVMADRRLRQVERVIQVADARLPALVRGDQGQQPQPDRVGQCLEQRRDLLGLLRAQWRGGQRGATGGRLRWAYHRQWNRHTSILTGVDACGKLAGDKR